MWRHDSAKKLIAEIEAMACPDECYDAKVKVLGEYIKHHVGKEEECDRAESSPRPKKGEEDLDAVRRERDQDAGRSSSPAQLGGPLGPLGATIQKPGGG